MRKLICLFMVLITCLAVFCSCGEYQSQIKTEERKETKQRFVEIYRNSSISSYVFVDTETMVQYYVNYHGGICPLIDENGNPLLYEGELE